MGRARGKLQKLAISENLFDFMVIDAFNRHDFPNFLATTSGLFGFFSSVPQKKYGRWKGEGGEEKFRNISKSSSFGTCRSKCRFRMRNEEKRTRKSLTKAILVKVSKGGMGHL